MSLKNDPIFEVICKDEHGSINVHKLTGVLYYIGSTPYGSYGYGMMSVLYNRDGSIMVEDNYEQHMRRSRLSNGNSKER